MKPAAWSILSLWIILIGSSEKASGQDQCIQTPCNGSAADKDHVTLVCLSSRIRIADVRDSVLAQRNCTVLDAVREKCMGLSTCYLGDRICPRNSSLVVHYECLDASDTLPAGNICRPKPKGAIRTKFGHIQNKGYPNKIHETAEDGGEYLCHWKIRPPAGHQVIINILDIHTSGSNEDCDAGLVISGNSCKSQDLASSNLCSREAGKKLIHCGNVDIKLRKSKIVFPLRFWLYYQMHTNNSALAEESKLNCLLNDFTQEGSSSSKGADITSDPGKKPSLTDILIILLSIISGISIVLFIILIVFCIRLRSLQLQGSEPLYNYQDISPGLQAHYEYISSLEPELDKNRPELVDGYFEVADALPALERGATPTSPAYAEVEQVAQMRRLIFSDEPASTHTDSSDGTYSLVTPGLGVAKHDKCVTSTGDVSQKDVVYYEPSSQNSSLTDLPSNNSGAKPKRSVLDRLKGVPGLAFGERDKKQAFPGNVSPKLNNNQNSNSLSARSVLKGKNGPSSARQKIGRLFGSREDVTSRDIPDTTSEAGSEPAYETVEEFVPVSVSGHGIKAKTSSDSQQEVPVKPCASPLAVGKQRWPNQKVNAKQHHSQIVNSVLPSTIQKGQPEIKTERLPIDKRERGKVASSPKLAKPKSAKAHSNIPSLNKSHVTSDKEQTLTNKSSSTAALPKSFTSKFSAEINKKIDSNDKPGTKNNNYKPTGLKDLPRSKGIVKNGIQKFEQSC